MKHAPFHIHFIGYALVLAILGGFGMGGHVVFVIAFNYPPSIYLGPMIQAHGHLQLLGWAGLFIMAVSSHMLPRLTNAKPPSKLILNSMLWCMVVGLLSRSMSHFMLVNQELDSLSRPLMAISGLLEAIAIGLYLKIIVTCVKEHRPQLNAFAASGIRPFLFTTLLGWPAFAVANLLVALHFSLGKAMLINQEWNTLLNSSFTELVILPVCFAFSINTLPVFLRLRTPTWPVFKIALAYTLSTLLQILFDVIFLTSRESWCLLLSTAFSAVRAMSILWFIWELDILTRLRAPWFRKFRQTDNRDSRPPRKNAADYGQFGHFEWFITGGYICLAIAAIGELINAACRLLLEMQQDFLGVDVIRHLYLLGFVSMLILGMAVRLVPGFVGMNRIAMPRLVSASFVLILLALIFRILPPLTWPYADVFFFKALWGTSGIWGMLAIMCLAANLFVTNRRARGFLIERVEKRTQCAINTK